MKSVGSKRPADIADHLNTTKEAVIAAIDANPNIFTKADRGWVKLSDNA